MTHEKIINGKGILFFCDCGRIKILDKWLFPQEAKSKELLNLKKAETNGMVKKINIKCPSCSASA